MPCRIGHPHRRRLVCTALGLVAALAAPVSPSAQTQHEACIALALDQPEAGIEAARAGIERGGGWQARHCEAVGWLALGRPEEAAPRLEALGGEAAPGVEVRALLLRDAARAWIAAGRPETARVAAARGLILAPDDVGLLTEHAIASAALGDAEQAIQNLGRAIHLAPSDANLLVLRAAAWRRAGHLDLAEADAMQAVRLDPLNAEAQVELGLLAEARGDQAGAARAYRQARELGAALAEPDPAPR